MTAVTIRPCPDIRLMEGLFAADPIMAGQTVLGQAQVGKVLRDFLTAVDRRTEAFA